MGLDIKTVIQEKTRWVASKLSLRKLRSTKRSRKAMETTELQPVALAGASRGFTGSSTQCNHFSRTPSGRKNSGQTVQKEAEHSPMDGRSVECANASSRR
ncbi:hypothetical protein GN244_ATG20199 [Phytophthora infestans]|uniref:Uncharacterized protein n=1 Tax=Phytophthora infestans TaxID=4787 RepID=A0A833S695_PHYIN|nr:hypothetical protein GN244_ATG20199 [Phytophthora infestans]